MKFRCIIVEDEPEPCALIREELAEIDCLEVVAEAGTVKKAYKIIQAEEPDALFLDISLIGGTGLDLLDKLKTDNIPIPPIVIMTAHTEEYAPQFFNSSFKLAIVHYIKKPFGNELSSQLLQAVNKIKVYWEEKKAAIALKNKFLHINNKETIKRIKHEDILYIETRVIGSGVSRTNDGAKIVTVLGEYDYVKSIRSILQNLPPNFIQISKTCVVNQDKVVEILKSDRMVVVVADKRKALGIGDAFYKDIMTQFKEDG
jgi:two-component system, LytTR family, response regulator